MYWIITEDSGSGYELLKEIAEKVVIETVKVVNPTTIFPSGGDMAAYKLFRHMLAEGEVQTGDTVYLAIDRITETSLRMSGEAEKQKTEQDSCAYLAEKKGINLIGSDYVCIEELMLSFKYLCEFCFITQKYSDKNIRYYIKNKTKFFYKKQTEENRTNFLWKFYRTLRNGDTLEQCLANLLKEMTSKFYAFRFTKSELGICWCNNCDEAKEHMSYRNLQNCGDCYASRQISIQDKENGAQRLTFVVRNSRLREIFDAMGVQLRYLVYVN